MYFFRSLLLLSLLCCSANAVDALATNSRLKSAVLKQDAGSQVLRFGLYYPHLSPYIYTAPINNQVIGIVPEVLAPFFKQHNITIEYVFDKVSALKRRLNNSDIDMMILNASWAINPEQVLFSAGVVPYNDYLYSRLPEQEITEPQQLDNKAICTRQYYVYPKLSALFTGELSLRVDSSNQAAQLRMLFSQRCDYAYINEIVAKWELQNQFQNQQIYRSAVYQDESMLTLGVSPKLEKLLPELNAYIQQQQQSGEIKRIINRYVHYD